MKLKTCSYFFLIICLIADLPSRTTARRKFKKKTKEEDTSGVDTLKLGAVCLKGLATNLPATFCWKRGGDVGVVPTGCREGFFRSLQLCFRNCVSGYRHILGICYKECAGDYSDHGLTCYKGFFNWYFKSSYIPESNTNFDSRTPCPRGMYLNGALCYKSCNIIDMENCGIASCSNSADGCVSTILTMASDTFQGVADAVVFLLTLGASTPAKVAQKSVLREALRNVAENQWKKAYTLAKVALQRGRFRNNILQKATNWAKTEGVKILPTHMKNFSVETFCKEVFSQTANKFNKPDELFNAENAIKAFDVFNLNEIVNECSDTSGENHALNCAKNIFTGLSPLDPTGLLTIVTTFMHPTCEINLENAPDVVPEESDLPLITRNCVKFFPECNYQGEHKSACNVARPWHIHNIDSINAKSIFSGENAEGYMYPFRDGNGIPKAFGKLTSIACFNLEKEDDQRFQRENLQIKNQVQSVLFNLDSTGCIYINYSSNNKPDGPNLKFCVGEENKIRNGGHSLPPQTNHIQIYSFKKGVKAEVWSEQSYRGTKWVLTPGYLQRPPILKINSYKVTMT